MTRPRRVLIVGGGISGLATAWHLGTDLDVRVVEAASRPGGKIATTTFRGRPLDLGADAFIVRNPAAIELCRELGLAEELIEPNSKSAAIFVRNELYPFPEGLVLGIPTDLGALYRSHIVGVVGVLRALRDHLPGAPVLSRHIADAIARGETDLSVAEVFEGRLGARILGALIDPLIGGINASDVTRLSLAAAAPQIFEQLVGKRSIMRALVRSQANRFETSGSIFRGLGEGMASLTGHLASRLSGRGVEVACNEAVKDISRVDGEFRIETSRQTRAADAVVLATPAFASAEIVRGHSEGLARMLSTIPYASVATVTFAWRAQDVPHHVAERLHRLGGPSAQSSTIPVASGLLPGSGVLVARDLGLMTTATSFASTKWPRSGNDDEVVIRASLGRHNDDRASALGDAELVSAVRNEITQILGIDQAPLEVVVKRWPASFPQYVTGHLTRVREIETLAASAGLDLVGAAYHGIGIPSCIAQAEIVAAQVRERLERSIPA